MTDRAGFAEAPLWFRVDGEPLLGILHQAVSGRNTGVVLVVGGPQYRVGSHRQFVLLARALAAAGFPVLRFDYRGMGDSPGAARDFAAVDADIAAAVNELEQRTGVSKVVLWGLCDGASAAMMYAGTDPRVSAIIALNPWVHTEQAEARVRLRSYYLERLLSRDLWRKLLRLDVDWRDSSASLRRFLRQARSGAGDTGGVTVDYVERMRRGLVASGAALYLILSGEDLTAREFDDLRTRDRAWQHTLDQVLRACCRFEDANHTFARADWRAQVERRCCDWVEEVAGE